MLTLMTALNMIKILQGSVATHKPCSEG